MIGSALIVVSITLPLVTSVLNVDALVLMEIPAMEAAEHLSHPFPVMVIAVRLSSIYHSCSNFQGDLMILAVRFVRVIGSAWSAAGATLLRDRRVTDAKPLALVAIRSMARVIWARMLSWCLND